MSSLHNGPLCTTAHSVYESTIYSLLFTRSHKQFNVASLQDNTLLRYTLYPSSVQDLYLPPRFLLQGQSYAFCQGCSLEAINQI